jgi:hypothetical protein
MTIRSQSNPYEVYCPHCSVTFPTGQKHCIHCGGRLSKERLEPGEFAIPFVEAEEAEAEIATRRSGWSPLALIWLLLFVGGTIYRSCAGE